MKVLGRVSRENSVVSLEIDFCEEVVVTGVAVYALVHHVQRQLLTFILCI